MNGYPGSVSSQASSSIAGASSSNLAYKEKPVVAIPPHASKTFSEYTIMGDVIQDCSISLMVEKGKPEGKTYTASESPINFTNYISYKKGENGVYKVVSNSFYLSGYNNYYYNDVIKKTKVGCKETMTLEYCEQAKADRFYVKYNNMHKNNYSKDAKTSSGK